MKSKIKILIINNDNEFCKRCESIISKFTSDFEVDIVTESEKGLKRIYQNSFEVVILGDNLTGEVDSFDLVRNALLMGKPIVMCLSEKWLNKLMFVFRNSDLMQNVIYLEEDFKDRDLIKAVVDLIGKKLPTTVSYDKKSNRLMSAIFKRSNFLQKVSMF